MIKPSSPLLFSCGKEMPNRFMLAPLTNRQSHENGQLSDEEYNWLVMRAKGKFGMVMTCASHVQKIGKGFPGQLGIFSDELKPGHQRLVKGIHAEGMLAVIQLHHAGMRSPKDLLDDEPVCPSDHRDPDARALSLEEVYQLREDFIAAVEAAYLDGKTEFKKPISCHLYPIRVKKFNDYKALNYDKWSICEPACACGDSLNVPVFRFLKEPLVRAFGEGF